MIEIKVEKVNAERTNVRFAVYADGKIWLKVTFVREENRRIGSFFKYRVCSLFKCREFYDESGRLVNRGHTVQIPAETYEDLQRRAVAILK